MFSIDSVYAIPTSFEDVITWEESFYGSDKLSSLSPAEKRALVCHEAEALYSGRDPEEDWD